MSGETASQDNAVAAQKAESASATSSRLLTRKDVSTSKKTNAAQLKVELQITIEVLEQDIALLKALEKELLTKDAEDAGAAIRILVKQVVMTNEEVETIAGDARLRQREEHYRADHQHRRRSQQ